MQPSSPPLTTSSSPLAPMPSPPLSPDIQSELKCRKRLILSDDDTPLAFMLKQRKIKHPDHPSPMTIAADSLNALRHSADSLKPDSSMKPTVDLNVGLYSSDHSASISHVSSAHTAFMGILDRLIASLVFLGRR
ncbi:hypothetical protein SLA2020_263740 [Shorea laevis]